MFLFLCVFFLNSVIEATFPSIEEIRKKQSLINDLRITDQMARRKSLDVSHPDHHTRSDNPFRDIILRNVDRVALGVLTSMSHTISYPVRSHLPVCMWCAYSLIYP
jgi:hypothetical protein